MGSRISIKAKLSQEDALRIVLSLAWSRNILALYIRVFISKILFNNDKIASLLMGVVIIVLILFTLPYVKNEIRYIDIGLYILFVTIYCITMIKTDRAGQYLFDRAIQILLTYVPLFFVGLVLNDERIDFLHTISIISIILFLLYSILIGNHTEAGSENMEDAYLILPHICIILYYYVKKKKNIYILLFIIGTCLILFYGSRGPVICLAINSLIIVTAYIKKGWRKNILIIFGIIVAGLINIYYETILLWFKSASNSFGLSSRVFDRMMTNTFFSTATRDPITKAVLLGIRERPYLGYGLAGDRLLVNVYAHNLILEILVSFGIIMGTILIAILLYLIISGLKKAQSSNERFFLLTLVCTNGILKLMMSGTYLREPYFFLLIGLCIGINRRYCYAMNKK